MDIESINLYITTNTITTINTMSTVEETYPCGCCDKEMTLDETNTVDEYGWVCDTCREECYMNSDADDDEYAPCSSCSKLEPMYNMITTHDGPNKGIYCDECYCNDYKPKKKIL